MERLVVCMEKTMNPCLILTHNNLDLTKRCVESLFAQDIPASPWIVDNGSTDGTLEWIIDNDLLLDASALNNGVSKGWNCGLGTLFGCSNQRQHCLVVGSDTVLAPWAYSALLSVDAPFVTGVDVGMSPLPEKPDIYPLSPHPDFSCFLIRRECWEKLGTFDESMVSYASDCDYHVRAHRERVMMVKASVPYNHERSSTMNRATPQVRHALQQRANLDREAFKAKWGCLPGTPEYSRLFT